MVRAGHKSFKNITECRQEEVGGINSLVVIKSPQGKNEKLSNYHIYLIYIYCTELSFFNSKALYRSRRTLNIIYRSLCWANKSICCCACARVRVSATPRSSALWHGHRWLGGFRSTIAPGNLRIQSPWLRSGPNNSRFQHSQSLPRT